MEHSISFERKHEHAGDDEAYDLESELAIAESRYAHASERSRRARDECHALESDLDARADAVKRARERYDAAEVKRLQLKRLIDQIEERLG
jgi:predicted nuclease with TOPRIM domain